MQERIKQYDGYLGDEPCRSMSNVDKFVTLFRFSDRDAVETWRNDEKHLLVQALGKQEVFSWYQITVAEVERQYVFEANL